MPCRSCASILGGVIFMMLNYLISAIFGGAGDTRTPFEDFVSYYNFEASSYLWLDLWRLGATADGGLWCLQLVRSRRGLSVVLWVSGCLLPGARVCRCAGPGVCLLTAILSGR